MSRVTQQKIQRLIKHLEKLEELTGKPLSKKLNFEEKMFNSLCPALQFAPMFDSSDRKLIHGTGTGVRYVIDGEINDYSPDRLIFPVPILVSDKKLLLDSQE